MATQGIEKETEEKNLLMYKVPNLYSKDDSQGIASITLLLSKCRFGLLRTDLKGYPLG